MADPIADPDHAALDDVLASDEFARRPSRPPDYAAEAKALAELAEAMTGPPQALFEKLTQLVLQLGPAESSGISILEPKTGNGFFRWPSVAGKWAAFTGQGLPRTASPCGVAIERNCPLLLKKPGQFFPEIAAVTPPVAEVLLVPFYANEKPVGTVWAIVHEPDRQFDAEDARLLTSLSRFAAAAYRLLAANDELERQLEVRTQELTEREERFRRLVEPFSQAVWETDARGMVVTDSPSWRAYTGQSLDEWLGEGWTKAVHPDDRDYALRQWQRAVAAGEVIDGEFRLRSPNGDWRWTNVRAAPLRNPDGSLRKWVGLNVDATDRKEAEHSLRQSEEKYRSLFNSMDEAYAVVEVLADDSGRWNDFLFVEVNPAFVKQSGMEYPVGRTATQILGTPNPRWFEIYGRVAETGEPVRLEEREETLDRIFDLYIFRLGGEGSRRVAVLFTDITERKRTEEALRTSEAKLAAIFSRAAVGLSEIGADGRFLRVNDELCSILGRTREELLAARVPDVTHHEDIEKSLTAVRKLLESGSPVSIDKRYVRSDGQLIFATSALTRLENAADDKPTILAVTVDLTDRKRAEEAVQLSEERLRLIIESATDHAILTLDEHRNVTLWSAGAAEIFGYSADEVIGRTGDIVFTPEDREAGVPEEEAETARSEGRAEDERWHLRKDGSRFYASGVTKPLRDSGVRGYVKVARDLTERKRFEEQLQAANDLLEVRVTKRTAELAASNQSLQAEMETRNQLQRRLMSAQEDERLRISRELHDQIGQLLAGLILGFRALEHGMDAKMVAKLHALRGIVEEIGREVHNLALELRPTALDDLGLVAATQNYVESWAARTGIETDFYAGNADRLPPDIETALYRIVQEALNNVLKHAKATRVSVLLERRNGQSIVIVEDNGRGIDVNQEIAAAQARGRLGVLGMRERLAVLGGTLEFESAPGEGTTMYARVPLMTSGDDGPEAQHA